MAAQQSKLTEKMSEPSNHWAALASLLGAEPAPEEPNPQPPPPKSVAAPKAPRQASPAPPRKPAAWDELASSLGVTPSPPPPPPPSPQANVPVKPATKPPARPPVEKPAEKAPFAREVAPAREVFVERREMVEEAVEEMAPAEERPSEASADEERRPGRRRHRRGRGRDRDRERERRGESSPREEAAMASEEEGSLEFRDEADDDIELEPPFEPAADRDSRSEEEASDRRGRRRRPRRGASSSRDRGPRRTSEAKEEAADEPTADESLDLRDAMEEESDSEEGAARPGLRNIPTWDEAVGVLVAANLESRAKRPGNGETRAAAADAAAAIPAAIAAPALPPEGGVRNWRRTGRGQTMRHRLSTMLAALVVVAVSLWMFGRWGVLYAAILLAVAAFARNAVSAVGRFFRASLILGPLFLLYSCSEPGQAEFMRRIQCQFQLKQIGAALFSYETSHGSLPPPVTTDKHGKPMHSWRATILPSLGEDRYRGYSFEEPWDGLNNRKLIKACPYPYICPSRASGRDSPRTDYVAVTGPGTIWDLAAKWGANLAPHWKRTVMVAEIADSNIDWAEPRDVTLDEACGGVRDRTSLAVSSHHAARGANVLFSDGSVEFIPADMPPALLRAVLTGEEGSREPYKEWERARRDRIEWIDFAAWSTLVLSYIALLSWPSGNSPAPARPASTDASLAL